MPDLLQDTEDMEKNNAEASILGAQSGGGKLSHLGPFAM